MRRFLPAALAILCATAFAQTPYIAPASPLPTLPADTGVTALQQDLQRLHTRASLLLIVAHPDDEDSGMLAFESRGHGVRTGMLTLTRGEGGQNVMTADFNDALGLIRTQELLSADRYSSVDQFFASTADFGFSKTMDETLANWSYDRVLCDAVRTVRLYRPLVVASVFLGGPTDGHGHHQVSGRLSQAVFTAAANPTVCPDQIAHGLLPWQPLKIYDRVPTFSISAQGIYDYATNQYAPARFFNYITNSWTDGAPSTDVTIPESDLSPLLGISYYQFARTGLALQKTQITNAIPFSSAAHNVPYHRFAAVPGINLSSGIQNEQKNFFNGIDTSLTSIASLAPHDSTLPAALASIDSDVTQSIAQLDPAHPDRIAPLLADGLARTNAILSHLAHARIPVVDRSYASSELLHKQSQFNSALIHALGLTLSATTNAPSPNITPGSALAGSLSLSSSIPLAPDAVSFSINSPATLHSTSPLSSTFTLTVPAHSAPTRPYFSRPTIQQPYYNIADDSLRLLPITPYPFTASAAVQYHGVSIHLQQILQSAPDAASTAPTPLVIVPPISVTLSPSAAVIPFDSPTLHLKVHLHSDSPSGASGTLRLTLPDGWTASPASAIIRLPGLATDQENLFTITPTHLTAQPYTLSAIATIDGLDFTDGYTAVGYPGLIASNLYRPATTHLTGVDLHVAPNLRIAYLQGTGDDLPAALTSLGLHVTTLSLDDLAAADLSRFDELILGVRAESAHPTLPALDSKLEAFVRAGGVLITQYNSKPFASTADRPIAPYPFDLSSFPENVVEEKAPVTLLDPSHPLFTFPNRITTTDFNNWIEERGHSFLRTWDAHYTPLTETHDTGQSPQRGGLLFARSGCGAYVYLAYALYRQTPEAVPGAYRLLANLASLPRNTAAVACPSTAATPAH